MSLLKQEPPEPVQSVDELLAIAHAMEYEAATHYSDLAERMRSEGNKALADVFDHLAEEERGHIDSLKRWSETEAGRPPDAARIRWTIPQTFDDEGASITAPRLLSAYRTLSMAVRNEERAFAFWTYVMAQAQRDDVRRAAEAMAREELQHVATLRRERRRAYWAQRSAQTSCTQAQDAAALESRLAGLLEEQAEVRQSDPLRRFAAEARTLAAALAGEPITLSQKSAVGIPVPDDTFALAEFLVDRYLEAADEQQDEATLARLQALAGRAIDRLAWLRSDLPELEASAAGRLPIL